MTTLDATTLARVLAEHEDRTMDLTTPRQYTQYGGWNQNCGCGYPLPDAGGEGGEDRVNTAHCAHVAEVLAALVAASETQARAEAWDACAFEAYDAGWTHDYGCNDLRKRNPNRAALSSTDQQGWHPAYPSDADGVGFRHPGNLGDCAECGFPLPATPPSGQQGGK
jgi:hypothetical protein